jgi:adenylate cyclase
MNAPKFVESASGRSNPPSNDVDVVQIGQELGVQYVLEGSVRRMGDKIRITTQLINASNGCHVWGDRFDRAHDEIFAVQDEVVRMIVGTLAGRSRHGSRQRGILLRPTSGRTKQFPLTNERAAL